MLLYILMICVSELLFKNIYCIKNSRSYIIKKNLLRFLENVQFCVDIFFEKV